MGVYGGQGRLKSRLSTAKSGNIRTKGTHLARKPTVANSFIRITAVRFHAILVYVNYHIIVVSLQSLSFSRSGVRRLILSSAVSDA